MDKPEIRILMLVQILNTLIKAEKNNNKRSRLFSSTNLQSSYRKEQDKQEFANSSLTTQGTV
jgi:hypothetical protein